VGRKEPKKIAVSCGRREGIRRRGENLIKAAERGPGGKRPGTPLSRGLKRWKTGAAVLPESKPTKVQKLARE